MAIEVDAQGSCVIDGIEYPAVGFGTYPLQNKTCLDAVTTAASLGYRILDTATFYENFEPIGKALKKLGRDNFYVISKVWPNAHTPELLRKDLKRTLEKLQTDYLDAYLLHWPNSKVPIKETLQAMEALKKEKLIRQIGLSNVTVGHLKRALEIGTPISWVQIEMHPLFYDAELLEFCKKHRISVQAWAPLARGRINDDPFLNKLGKKYGKTSAQIALRWIVQHGCIPLPSSTNPKHMGQNRNIEDFALSQKEMQEIDERAEEGKRERIIEEYGLGFTDEFDFSYDECWPKHH